MKILHYLLGASILISGIDLIFTISTGSLQACPRCRRALPKGPRKRPHPGFPGSNRHNKQLPQISPNITKETIITPPNSCAGSCCCARQNNSSIRPSQNSSQENLSE